MYGLGGAKRSRRFASGGTGQNHFYDPAERSRRRYQIVVNFKAFFDDRKDWIALETATEITGEKLPL